MTKNCFRCQKQSNIWHWLYDPATKKVEIVLVELEPTSNQQVFCSKNCYEKQLFPQKHQEQHRLSHCAVCDKKSLVYHYIYDKRTKVLEETNSNATNPEHQWVFCTEKHFKEWESIRKQEAEKELNLAYEKLKTEKKDLKVPNFPTKEELKEKQDQDQLETYVQQILTEIKVIRETKTNTETKGDNSKTSDSNQSFFAKNKGLVIGGGIAVLLIIGGLIFWIVKLKKAKSSYL